jgi:hypothetical protein
VAAADIDIEIPGHRVLRPLGRGGMANVYLAIQESMEREVALKVLLPSLGASDPSFGERFIREAKIVAKLSHPHVNAVFDVGVAGPYHYFTMEYLTGGDLKSRIRRGMSPKTVLAVARQIASALAFAHSKGYVHRDVKPENVLFRDSTTAVLTDFGIAKTNDAASNMTATGAIVGTPHYMSPEQAMGRPIDKRADIYSLGAMVFEMFSGKQPYTGDSAISIGIKHLKDPLPQLAPALRAYQPLLEKFMAKDPSHRFQTGEEAMAAIDVVINGGQVLSNSAAANSPIGIDRTVVLGPGTATSDTVLSGTAQKKSGRGMLVAAVLLAPLIAGTAYIALRNSTQPPLRPTASASATVDPIASAAQADLAALAAQIMQLLTEADQAALAGKYLGPEDSAAVPKYRRVLELEPGNIQATRALTEIAGQFIAQAERAIETGKFGQAAVFLRQAEEADSSHPMLFSRRLALKEYRQNRAARPDVPARDKRRAEAAAPARDQTVEKAEDAGTRARFERGQKLRGLLARFRDLVSPGALSATRAGRAQDLMREATQLAPDDTRVRALPGQLADAYLRLAATKAEEKEYQEAGTLIQHGLELKPDHQQLLALQNDITEKKNRNRPTFGTF